MPNIKTLTRDSHLAGVNSTPLRASALPVSDRLYLLGIDLDVDRVWTWPMVVRRYGKITQQHVLDAGFVLSKRRLPPFSGASRRVLVTFVSRNRTVVELGDAAIAHAVGVACLRQLLGCAADNWFLPPRKGRGTVNSVPDALTAVGNKLAAVEYDYGSYRRSAVTQKMVGFKRAYGPQVWGMHSEVRAANMRALAAEQRIRTVWFCVVSPYW